MSLSADEAAAVKSCCASAYGTDAVALVLGESYHPGGLALTRSLLSRLQLREGSRVLDVASGPGATALLAAREHPVQVDGVDLGEASVERARAAAAAAGLAERVRFHVGDAERLPFGDGVFDAAICECAFCTFPDKATAAAELARVLRPGGRLGLTDVTVDPTRLDGELSRLAGWVACLADARPAEEYARLLGAAGLRVVEEQAQQEAMATMIDQIEARLRVLRVMPGAAGALDGVDLDGVLAMVEVARGAVRRGIAGYTLLVAVRE